MTTYIALIRGINVSGKNPVKMESLRDSLTDLGFKNVRTYIQSGNIVFDSSTKSEDALTSLIQNQIKKSLKHSVVVVVVEAAKFKKIIAGSPFKKRSSSDAAFFHVSFFSKNPTKDGQDTVLAIDAGKDEIKFLGKCAYLYCPDGYGRSKLSNNALERKLKLEATTRNWKTVMTLLEMANSKAGPD